MQSKKEVKIINKKCLDTLISNFDNIEKRAITFIEDLRNGYKSYSFLAIEINQNMPNLTLAETIRHKIITNAINEDIDNISMCISLCVKPIHISDITTFLFNHEIDEYDDTILIERFLNNIEVDILKNIIIF